MKLDPRDISLDTLRHLWSGAEASLDDAAMSRIACAGSGAPVSGRPITSTDAPSSGAWRGVTTLF